MTMNRSRRCRKLAVTALVVLQVSIPCNSFTLIPQLSAVRQSTRLYSDSWDGDQSAQDSNTWSSSNDPEYQDAGDWQELLAKKDDGSFWSEFEPSTEDSVVKESNAGTVEDAADAWLDTIASLSAEEVNFNLKEADRADKARQMEEWGFEAETIANTLDIAMDDKLEASEEVQGMREYRQESYLDDDIDLTTVESHTRVDKDPETGEPIRSQMVYVDEHTCIGCTNCAMIAQSTFYMNEEHGRARVFEQWGDDEETIQIAIETCPVDCIHYGRSLWWIGICFVTVMQCSHFIFCFFVCL